MTATLHFGHLRLSVFGLIVAAGLLGAMTFSQRTARAAGVAPDAVWNTGIFALGAAFVFSRLLLIAVSPAALLHYPLLLLSLPSLTWTGIALTLFAVLVYLRVQKLPLLRVMDAYAPTAMLLAATLALAHFVEGSDAGMPTAMRWGPLDGHLLRGSLVGPTLPVQIFAAAAAVLLFGVSWSVLRRGFVAGTAAAVTLTAAGLAAFALDMFAQPFDVRGTSWLDPGQFVALACVVAGFVLFVVITGLVEKERA